MTGKSGREAALDALEAARRRSAWPEEVLRTDRGLTDSRELALAMRLCLGVQQTEYLLDWYLARWTDRGPEKLDPPVRTLLRLGLYQIMFLDRVPDRAAVDETVTLARKRVHPGAAGLVNAVLRRAAREWREVPPPQDPTILYTCPAWLYDELSARLGAEETAEFLKAVNTPGPITLQVNTLRATASEALESLRSQGARAELHPTLPDCILLSGGSPEKLEVFQKGLVYVQDAAARLVTEAAELRPGMTMLDACGAPGGKSFAAAIRMGDRGTVLTRDLHENKLRRVREGAERLGLTCIRTRAADASDREAVFPADLVIADVPCSGFGVLRSKPGIRFKDPADLAALPAVQTRILSDLAESVKPGGLLLYSTCTIFSRENEEIVRSFLAARPDFVLEPFSCPLAGSTDGMVQLWPQRHGSDGFFIARLRRKEAPS